MHKAMITKAFVGSLGGFAGAVVLFLLAGGLARWNDSLIMNGPDVVGIRTDPFGWVMIELAGMAVLVMVGAAIWPPGSDPSGIGVCRCSGGFTPSACRPCCTPLSRPSCS